MKIVLLSFIFLFGFLNNNKPTFLNYSVKIEFNGKPASVDLESHPKARTYRTRLREGQAKGPNFADHYTIIIWGCGSQCQRFAIMNAIDGKVYFPHTNYSTNGIKFRRDSNLLIIDPLDSAAVSDFHEYIPENWITKFMKWDGKDLILIDTTRTITKIN